MLTELAARAVAMARAAPEDPWAGLAERERLADANAPPDLDINDAAPPSEPDALVEIALRAEAAARAVDGVSQVESAAAGWRRAVVAYATSKWGLRGLTKAAALELGRSGIRVNAVCPSGGNPGMYGPWFDKLAELAPQTQAYVADRAIPGEASLESIADAVVYLASDASRHTTGIDLPVDGGASPSSDQRRRWSRIRVDRRRDGTSPCRARWRTGAP